MTDGKPSKAELEAQVDTESAKRTAKKSTQRKAKSSDLVEVVMRGTGRDAGTTRKVTAEAAERLVRQGHARLA